MNLETKHVPAQVKSADVATGQATFLVSVFNTVDDGGDVMLKGAFAETLTMRTPKLVADHEWKVTHKLGKFIAGRETDEGLEVDVLFNMDKQMSREVFSDFIFDPEGAEFSFGYDVPEGGAEFRDGARLLSKVNLYEVGPVLIGMHPSTRLVGAKSDTRTDPDGNTWQLVPATPPVAEAPPVKQDDPKPVDESDPAFDELTGRLGEVETALQEVLARD